MLTANSKEEAKKIIKDNTVVDEHGCWLWKGDERIYVRGKMLTPQQLSMWAYDKINIVFSEEN